MLKALKGKTPARMEVEIWMVKNAIRKEIRIVDREKHPQKSN